MDREVWRLQFLRLQSQTRLSIRVHALGWPLSVLTSLTLTYLALPPPWLHSVYILPSPGTALPQKSGHHAPHSLISDPSSSHILQRSIDLVMTSSPWTDPTAFPLPHPFLTPHHSSHQLSFHDLLWSLVIPIAPKVTTPFSLHPFDTPGKAPPLMKFNHPCWHWSLWTLLENSTPLCSLPSFRRWPQHWTGILVNVLVCSLPHCLQFLLCPYTSLIP